MSYKVTNALRRPVNGVNTRRMRRYGRHVAAGKNTIGAGARAGGQVVTSGTHRGQRARYTWSTRARVDNPP